MNYVIKRLKETPYIRMVVCVVVLFKFLSCSQERSVTVDDVQPYDPSKPVQLTRFYPDSGGYATKIILEGLNFGNDPSIVKVYYNQKQAAVVRNAGDIIYAITPRQPGDTCTISVVVGSDSVVYPDKFVYTTEIALSTVVGYPNANLNVGGTLGEARLQKPQFIAVDPENNIFVTNEGNGLYLISEASDVVMILLSSGTYNAPTLDHSTDRHLLIPANAGNPYLRFSIDDGFSYRSLNPVRMPNPDIGISSWTFAYKHQYASCREDGMIYFGSRTDSYIVRLDPATREMIPLFDLRSYQSNYFAMFHSIDHHILYLVARNRHCIYTFDIHTSEFKLFAGKENQPGYADGDRLETALFNEPIQVDFDADGNLFVADRLNHCIRKITPEGMVTTVIGIGGTAGFNDGTQDYALLNTPWGVAVDSEGSVYIADYGNQCVRKLSIQ
jgi:hypothetical protein